MSSDNLSGINVSDFVSIVGENAAFTWDDAEISNQIHIQRGIITDNLPNCVVYPQTQRQLASTIKLAHSNHWRVLVCGSGSKLDWGGLSTKVDLLISTERLNTLVEHAVGDLTVTVEAGMKFAQLQELIAVSNQFLPIDPTVPNSATIGGIIATGDNGSLRQRYGSVRDQVLGITFVRSDGEITKAGGRVVKNVAGYDLMKLFTGSYGSLGIITQATLRLYPKQEASGTVVLVGNMDAIASSANVLRGSALTPTQADIISTQVVANLGLGKGLGLIVRFQSIPESVTEQSKRLLEVGEKLGLQGTTYSHDEGKLWGRLQQQMQPNQNDTQITCKIGVSPTAAVEILSQVEVGLVHIGSGLGILHLENSSRIESTRSLCEQNGGFLTILTAPMEVKEKFDVWGYKGNALGMMQRIKRQFDPTNILNPGKFVGGI
ncbi:FAD-binding oxidoreductase [Calothrix sp. PCC 6303]|uniref:FAD-binding oxidoreductase n=1 Tax=Calothrix sp. PCC 6303 TaxID=1170562 RepID=UPI0002A04F2C|nr:FAD-binding oxidoreductase [Calothrix sp. PCC 6303]AFY99203.1 FAD linked oxidase domain protein [Calothrix sp. PCC 6303]